MRNDESKSFKQSEIEKQMLEDICAYISENISNNIGWLELTQHSGLTHIEIISLFEALDTTPMIYIRDAKRRYSLGF